MHQHTMETRQHQRYRIIGAELARYICEHNGDLPAIYILQAITADLAGHDEQLLLPLKTLVSKPGFLALLPLAGSGSGEIQRYALLRDLENTFSEATIARISTVLDGFLGITRSSEEERGSAGKDAHHLVPLGTPVLQSGLAKIIKSRVGRNELVLLLILVTGSLACFFFLQGRLFSNIKREASVPSAKIVNGREVFYEYAEAEDVVLCDERKAERWQESTPCRFKEGIYKGRWITFASHKDFCRFFRDQGGVGDTCKIGAPASEGYQYSGDIYCGDVIDPYQTPCFVLLGPIGKMKKSVFPSKKIYCANTPEDPICSGLHKPRSPENADI